MSLNQNTNVVAVANKIQTIITNPNSKAVIYSFTILLALKMLINSNYEVDYSNEIDGNLHKLSIKPHN